MESEIIYGIRPIVEAIKAGVKIYKIWLLKDKKNLLFKEVEEYAFKKKIDLLFTSNKKLDKLSKKNHQGVIARISPIKLLDLNQIDTIIKEIKSPLLLILDQINDVRNFGAIIRTAEVAGVTAVVIQNSSSAPVNSDTIKTSAGAIFNIPVCKVNHIKDAIYHFKSLGVSIVSKFLLIMY